jgi:hypothetical protein
VAPGRIGPDRNDGPGRGRAGGARWPSAGRRRPARRACARPLLFCVSISWAELELTLAECRRRSEPLSPTLTWMMAAALFFRACWNSHFVVSRSPVAMGTPRAEESRRLALEPGLDQLAMQDGGPQVRVVPGGVGGGGLSAAARAAQGRRRSRDQVHHQQLVSLGTHHDDGRGASIAGPLDRRGGRPGARGRAARSASSAPATRCDRCRRPPTRRPFVSSARRRGPPWSPSRATTRRTTLHPGPEIQSPCGMRPNVWRDPDSNRGHHEFQTDAPNARTRPGYDLGGLS